MKIILITILFFLQVIAFNCQAQYEYDSLEINSIDTILPPYTEPAHHSITAVEIYYSSKVFNNQFYNSFNQIDHINFNQPLNEVGIGFSGRLTATGSNFDSSHHTFDGHLSFKTIVPVKLAINDSINSILSSSTFSFHCGKDLFYSLSNFDLIVSGGLDFGRITLKNANYKTQKNPFFNPTISIQPRVKIKKIVLSLRMDCWNDISKGVWKSTLFSRFSKENSYNINHFRQSGMRFSIGIGYSFN